VLTEIAALGEAQETFIRQLPDERLQQSLEGNPAAIAGNHFYTISANITLESADLVRHFRYFMKAERLSK